jgi:hypothetical protein
MSDLETGLTALRELLAALPFDVRQALLVALLAAAMLGHRRYVRPWRKRDPQRWFDSSQRYLVRSRVGRCEYGQPFRPWRRCPGRVEQIDHFYPWARGGATAISNAVGACIRHNQGKGGTMPSSATRWLIARRRRDYWPTSNTRVPGAWYRRSQDRYGR